jgi:hypothetical protein
MDVIGDAPQNRVNVQTTKPLEVKEREFAAEFGWCLAKVLRREPIKPRYRNDVGKYVVEQRSLEDSSIQKGVLRRVVT